MDGRCLGGIAALLLSGATVAAAENPDEKTSKVADAWMGRPASDLLLQWPVDRFRQSENEETDETYYTWNFGTEAYSYDDPIMSGPYQAGMIMQGNVPVSPIIRNDVVGYNRVDVAAQHHCEITFTANSDGVISGYQYNGVKCRPYVKSWGMPKKKK